MLLHENLAVALGKVRPFLGPSMGVVLVSAMLTGRRARWVAFLTGIAVVYPNWAFLLVQSINIVAWLGLHLSDRLHLLGKLPPSVDLGWLGWSIR